MAASLAGLTLVAVACGGGGGSTTKSGSSAANSSSGGSSSASSSSSSSATPKSSGGSSSPTQAITDALSASGQSSGTVTFGLFGSAADFEALGSTSGPASTRAEAEKLLPTSTLSVSYEKGSGAGQGKEEISLTLGTDQNAFQAIVASGTIYLRVDVNGIASAAGGSASKITAEAGAAEGEFPFIKTLLDGGFVSLDLKSLSALSKQFAGAGGATTPTTVGSGQVKQMIAGLKTALTTGTTITKVGSDSVGDHYQVVVMPQQLVTALQQDVSSAAGPLSSELGKADGSLSKLSNKPVTVDVWISGGKLKQIELDLRQFHQGAGGPANPVGLKITFGPESGSISIPSGATPVDLSSLGGLLGGLAGAKGGASGA